MAAEYARLDLRQAVHIPGGTSNELIIYRPTCRDLLGLAGAANRPADQVRYFAGRCCRAVNGGAEPAEFKANELDAADAAELSNLAAEFFSAAQSYEIPDDAGDGVTSPLFYDCRHPIRLTRGPESDPIEITQIEFQARRLGEISEFLDTPAGSAEEFMSFMRTFAKLGGVNLPITEVVFDAMDYTDYIIIRAKIMGKLVRSRGRWRKIST